MLSKPLSVLIASAIVAGTAMAAQATVLPVTGGSGPPDSLNVGTGSTLVADTGLLSFSTSAFSGTIEEWVWEDTANTFGSGDLTWTIQVTNNGSSTDALGRVTAGDFGKFLTDVGDNGGANGPDLVTRGTPGHVVGFVYLTGLIPGETSDLLTIDTNATRFTPGTLAVIDSKTADLTGYQPSAIPEPATWAMMAFGFAGLGFAGYRRSRKIDAFAA